MSKIGILNYLKGIKKSVQNMKYAKMMNGYTPVFNQFGNNVYASDIVQNAISIICNDMSKLCPKHIRINPEDQMQSVVNDELNRLLKFGPNPLMTTSDFISKIVFQYEYNKNASTSKIPQLANNSLEYVIIEYTTSLSNNTKTTKDGQYSTVGIEVCNLDGSSLINENNDYIIRKFTLENSVGLQSNDSGSTKIVLTLPKALTEFVVKLGDNRNNMASFRVS